MKGFKEFISKGNVLELAVAVIIGTAFTPIVDSVTKVIMDMIGALIGEPNFDSVLQFTINGSDPIRPGTIITAVVNFLLITAAVYFAIVLPMNTIKKAQATEKNKENPEEKEKEEISQEIKLLSEIRDLLASQNTSA